MKLTVLLISFFGHLLLPTHSEVTTEKSKNITIIDGSSLNSIVREGAVAKRIVIHTQVPHYDQPTLKDYQECFENLKKCKTVCDGVLNPLECTKQCPVCPVLIKEQVVVQGVNDTDYRSASSPPLNTTNIIRLTNEIHNIIESQSGNITYNNENILHVSQNVSRVGGKFGLGYNNTDPCCIILSTAKSCDSKRFSTSTRCHQKRHRVCSKKCSYRIMQAKRITVCEKLSPEDESEDYIEENCYETVKYVKYHGQKRRRFRSRNKCAYIPSWPYVTCGHKNIRYRVSVCRRCHRLTYEYVLRRGIPAQCTGCFIKHANSNHETHPMRWETGFMSPNVNHGFDYVDFDSEMSDWHHDRTLCRLPNGDISENCSNTDGIPTESAPSIFNNPLKNTRGDVMPEAQGEDILQSLDDVYNDYYDDNYEQIYRNRRYIFTPSKYSRRHKYVDRSVV